MILKLTRTSCRIGALVGALSVTSLPLLTAAPAGSSVQAAVPVQGRVVDPDGSPVSDATIAIVSERGVRTTECIGGLVPKAAAGDGYNDSEGCLSVLRREGAVRAEAVSGAGGRFVVNVPSGLSNLDRVRIEARSPDGTRLFGTLPIAANRRLPVSDLGNLVASRWYDLVVIAVGNGQPIRDAEVIFDAARIYHTNANGAARHQFVAAPRGTLSGLSVLVRAPGFADEAWFGGVPAQNTTQVFTLVPETRVSGRTLDPTGRPVVGAMVRLECGGVAGAIHL